MDEKNQKIAASPNLESLLASNEQGLSEAQQRNVERLRLMLTNSTLGTNILWDNEIRTELRLILFGIDPSLGCEICGEFNVVDGTFLSGTQLVLNGGTPL